MTARNPSKITIDGDLAYIHTSQGYVGIIDVVDIRLAQGHAWQAIGKGGARYLCRRYRLEGKTKTERLHRRIVAAPDDMYVDHADGNPLNNRRANLRVCTQAENAANKAFASATGVVGVYKTTPGRFIARICIDGVHRHLGTFGSREEASKAYKQARHIRPEFYERTPEASELTEERSFVDDYAKAFEIANPGKPAPSLTLVGGGWVIMQLPGSTRTVRRRKAELIKMTTKLRNTVAA